MGRRWLVKRSSKPRCDAMGAGIMGWQDGEKVGMMAVARKENGKKKKRNSRRLGRRVCRPGRDSVSQLVSEGRWQESSAAPRRVAMQGRWMYRGAVDRTGRGLEDDGDNVNIQSPAAVQPCVVGVVDRALFCPPRYG